MYYILDYFCGKLNIQLERKFSSAYISTYFTHKAKSASFFRGIQKKHPFVVVTALATRSRGYKTFFMLNSIEHEILNAHKYKKVKKFCFLQAQIRLECYFSRS